MNFYELKFNNPYPQIDPKEEALKSKKEGDAPAGKFDQLEEILSKYKAKEEKKRKHKKSKK